MSENQQPQDQEDYSDTNYSIFARNGRQNFIPPWVWEVLPGISKQARRAWILEQERLTPRSFTGLVLEACNWYGWVYILVALLRIFLSDFIMYHLFGIITFVSFGAVGYLIHQITVINNNSNLEEEVVLFTWIRLVGVVFAIYAATI